MFAIVGHTINAVDLSYNNFTEYLISSISWTCPHCTSDLSQQNIHDANSAKNCSDDDSPEDNLLINSNQFLSPNKKIKGFIIGHLNIQNIKSGTKLDELRVLLSKDPRIHILTLSETWLNDNWTDSMISIDNYSIIRRDRSTSTNGGGTLIYIHNSIQFTVRNDLTTNHLLECICVEISIPYTAPFLVINIYIPPSANTVYDATLKTCIENISHENKEYYILGDFNIDLLNPKNRKNKLYKSLNALGLQQLVSSPTRVHSKQIDEDFTITRTLIDHIYVSHPNNIDRVQVPELTLSDHYPVFVVRRCNAALRKQRMKNEHSHHHIKYRTFKNFDKCKFFDDLKKAPWSSIECFNDPSDALDMWYKIYNDIIDTHIPLREKRVKSISLPQWLSRELLSSIRTRNRLKKLAKNREQWCEYKSFRNQVTYQIRCAKRSFYSDQIESNRKDSGKLWQVLKNAAGISKQGNLLTNITHNDKTLTDKHEIANAFNLHFSSVAAKVLSETKSREVLHSDTRQEALSSVDRFVSLQTPFPPLVSIPLMTEEFLIKQLNDLPNNKAKGADAMNVKLLKHACPHIIPSLRHIYNLSITSGIFPQQWKISKITPVHKSQMPFLD